MVRVTGAGMAGIMQCGAKLIAHREFLDERVRGNCRAGQAGGATLIISANSLLNCIQSFACSSQTACHATDELSRVAQHNSQGVVMNSFTVTAVGNLAKNPELAVKGDTTYTRICLVGNDYAGKDEQGNAREAVTSLWFVAFESLGESIAKNARKGDQLILQAQIRSNNWTDREGEKQYDYSFVIQNFRFGAPGKIKREELAARRDEREGALETEI
jgi:single-strand DNA-binding protein